jgi:hypothetical protein
VRVSFRSMNFAGSLHSILNGKDNLDVTEVITAIEESWQECPIELFDYISQKANGKPSNYRSLIWELYLWRCFELVNCKLQYEYRDSLNGKSIDFLIKSNQDSIFLLEAISIGPNDDNLLSYLVKNDEYLTKKRRALESKVPKLANGRGISSVLALSDSFLRFPNTIFDTIQLLYGRPALQISKVSNETSLVLADYGFWSNSFNKEVMFDAVLLGYGVFPGFSSTQRMQLWLNPESLIPLHAQTFPLDVDFYSTTSSDIWVTNSQENFVWKKISLYS